MVKRMLIDATHAEETRVVVMNGTRLDEFDVETSTKKQIKGNVYLAKVVRVEPSLQAAFVDYGGNRHGFLAFNEIHPDYYQIPVADRRKLLAEAEAQTVSGNEDIAEAAEVESVGGEDAVEEEVGERRRLRIMRDYKIQEVIKRRQILLVQVVKEERGNKGAALTTYLSLAGRYCVLMPNTARGGGVSRKITNVAERRKLKEIINGLSIPEGMAVILRTAGAQHGKAEIKRDYDYLLRTWEMIRETTLKSIAPALIHEEGNLIKRSIRDIYSRDIDEILVEGDEGYRLAKDFMKMLTPSHAKKVQPYRDPAMPLFHRYQVESQLDAMHSPTVQLRSGGYIVINQTEALVAIDVNSGRSTRERHIEETALKTNLEAADEVARQLRLRDLAGLVVIDFIDMEEGRNNQAVERRLKEAMKDDRARIQLGRISPFGLLELSRQRLRPSLMETSFEVCPQCRGLGVVRSVESTAVHILRLIEEEGVRRRSSEVTITVAPSVALYILNQKRTRLSEIESRYGFRVFIEGDPELIPPAYQMDRIKGTPGDEAEAAEEVVPASDAEPRSEDAPGAADEEAPARAEGGEDEAQGRRKRRRRRRRRKGEGEDVQAESRDGGEGEAGSRADGQEEVDEDDEESVGEEARSAETDASRLETGEPPRKRRRGKRGGRRQRRRLQEPAEGAASVEPAEAPVEAPVQPSERAAEEDGPAVSRDISGAGPQALAVPSGHPEPGSEPASDPGSGSPSDFAPDRGEVVAGDPAAAVEKPKRRRATRTRKGAPPEGADADVEPQGAEASDAGAPLEEKPKRRRSPARKKATAPVSEEAATADGAHAEVEPEKPKRRRSASRKKPETAEPPETPKVTETSAALLKPQEPAPRAPEPALTSGAASGSGKEAPLADESPVIVATEEGEKVAKSPPKRGWWQRLME